MTDKQASEKIRALLATGGGVLSGSELRARLNGGTPWWRFWARYSGVGFYSLMARLEDWGEVEGYWKEEAVAGGVEVPRRYFRWTGGIKE